MRCGFRMKKTALVRPERIAGIDEAGRGALAGRSCGGRDFTRTFPAPEAEDSKQLAPELREEIYHYLTTRSDIVWAVALSIR